MTWKDGIPYDCYNRKIEIGDTLVLIHRYSTNIEIVTEIREGKLYYNYIYYEWDAEKTKRVSTHKMRVLKQPCYESNSIFIIKKHYESDGNKSN